MEISLRYVTHFVYATPVWESHNLLRACPTDGGGQMLLAYEVRVEPYATVFSYTDSWGTRVDVFDVPQAHSELVVTASAHVATTPPDDPAWAPLEAISSQAYRDEMWRFLQPTRHTRWGRDIESAARSVVEGASGIVDATASIEALINDRMDYQSGTTEVGVEVSRVWADGAGVCQDFAHLTIAMLRSVGIAARYVSGYFYASDPTSADADDTDEIVVATHAWVEVAIPGSGWWAVDPTNLSPVGERHVKIGHGRDYDDVTPLRGVYYGESDHRLAAAVSMSTSRIVNETVPVVELGEDALRAQQQ